MTFTGGSDHYSSIKTSARDSKKLFDSAQSQTSTSEGVKKNWNNPGKLNESFPDGLEDIDTDTDKDSQNRSRRPCHCRSNSWFHVLFYSGLDCLFTLSLNKYLIFGLNKTI